MSHRNHRITIVYSRIEFVTWISSIVTWNLSHGCRLLPHRICHVDIVYRHIIIVYCHIVIVYHRIDVVTCSSLHNVTFRATLYMYLCLHACMCLCVCECMHEHMCACVTLCLFVYVCRIATYTLIKQSVIKTWILYNFKF